MSSIANNVELSSDRQLSADSCGTRNQDTPSHSAEMDGRVEVVEGLDLVPVPPGSTWLEHDSVNEYVQLCNDMYTSTDIDCGLPSILEHYGYPQGPLNEVDCSCDHNEDHTCWLSAEFCGTRREHGQRRSRLVDALHEAICAQKNGLLRMYHRSTIRGDDPHSNSRQAGLHTPGLHKLATMRLDSLTNGVKRLKEYHNVRANTASDDSKAAFSDGNGDTGDEDLADLEKLLIACKADLLTPLRLVPDTKASIIKAAQDLKLAVRTYDDEVTGPRAAVRKYYDMCVLKVGDAGPSLEHYEDHLHCQGLGCDLKDIDDGYREARDKLDWSYNSDEMSDGLGEILRSLWDETRSCFESVGFHVLGDDFLRRPHDLESDSDDDELDDSEGPDEDIEDD